jgi:hypothetical protein
MQITPINENNTNFQGLHVSKQALKIMGTSRRALLKNPAIKEAADKFEVLVKPSRETYTKEISWSNEKEFAVILSSSVGMVAGALFSLTGWTMFPLGVAVGLVSAYGLVKGISRPYKEVTNNMMLIQGGERFENGNLAGIKTDQYEIESTTDSLPNLVRLLKYRIYGSKSKNIDADNLFTSQNYLAMLDENAIGKGSADFLHKRINDKGDTLLTQFFDIYPEENPKAYDQIIKRLKKIDGLDFNQKGALVVSCLEKIINSENDKVLPLIKDFEFNYTPELEYAYQNIRNKKFKEKIKNLNIKFPDILEAVRLQSHDALYRLEGQLDSPLCNRKQLAREINKVLKELKDPSFEGYFKSIYLKYMNTGEANLLD